MQQNRHQNPSEDFKCTDTGTIKGVMPFLLDMHPEDIKNGVKPSKMLAALMLSTEERLAKLQSPLRKYKVGTKKDAFIRCPEAIIFQNFKAGTIYKTTLTVTNQRSIPQNLKLYFETSRFFTITTDKDQNISTKFAPGMSNVYTISFAPSDSDRDFFHGISFFSEDSEFYVPIFALGPRPITYMPDKVKLPPTLVKVESSKSIILKNSGEMSLDFTQIVQDPFSTSISRGILFPDGILEVKYSCYPLEPGYTVGKVKAYFRDDFCIAVDLECDVKSIKVQLDTNLLSFEDVYMGLYGRKTLTLVNTSDHCLNFAWKMNPMEDENTKLTKLVNLMENMKEYEQARYEKLEFMDIVSKEGHASIYERIFKDEKEELLRSHALLYKSDFFEIIPIVGKVLPNSRFEFYVIFGPKQNIFYYSSAYLDIEGSEMRTRLCLQGNGVGPPVELRVKNLDAGQIYLTDKHQYEVSVTNKGVTTATVTYQPKETDWGGVISCIPDSQSLEGNCTKGFVIVFSSKVQGEFLETLDFVVVESGERLQCIFTGNVICPLLKCIPEAIDFGTVSVGSSTTKELQLKNDSRVAITFQFEFDDDRSMQSESEDIMEIVPVIGKVPALGSVVAKITFASKKVLEWTTDILVVMWKSSAYTVKVPVRAICACPQISCDPRTINIKFCFLNCEYIRTIVLKNEGECKGYLEYVQPKDSDESSIHCTPSQTKVCFEGFQSHQLDVKIVVTKLGPHELPLNFAIVGGGVQTLCNISCNGQGPVVSYHPDEIDFGTIEVLNQCEHKLKLVNDSPIAASIRVYIKGNTSFYIAAGDETLDVSPEEEREITVLALFNNPGRHKDMIYLEIQQGDLSGIKVYGEGFGTSILCEPKLSPSVNFGTLLTYKPFNKVVQLTNKGNYRHKLLFTKRNPIRSLKETEDDLLPGIFEIEPRYLELDPQMSASITIKASVKKPKLAVEEYFCHALIGKSAVIQTIIHFFLEADFVDPKFSFSTFEMDFKLNITGSHSEGKVEDELRVENKTGIPLNVFFTMDDAADNFTIVRADHKADKNRQSSLVAVKYNPHISEKRRTSQKARLIVEYEDHPKTDIIDLHGELMFPTVKMYPNEIDFQCVPLGSTSSKTILIQNVSAMMVSFKWFWLEQSVKITDLAPAKESVKPSATFKAIKVCSDIEHTPDFMDYIDAKASTQGQPSDNLLKKSFISDRSASLSSRSLKLTYESTRYLEDMRNVLYSVLSPYIPAKTELLHASTLIQPKENSVTKMLSLEPSQGILKPNEYSIVTIGFTPPPNTEVKATAICKVQFGEEEPLVITGKSSKLSYELDKSCVNFGTQVFCEMGTRHLTLHNTGLCTIDFKVGLEEPLSIQADVMHVNPKSGSVAPGGRFSIKVDYFPGIPGIFNKFFTLELGYLEPVTIEVSGYSVLNQVHLQLPRGPMNLDLEDAYKAVTWITSEYLDLTSNEESGEFYDNPNDPRHFLEENDWVYVSYNDCYPTVVDIDMAMERVGTYNLICKNPKLLKESNLIKRVQNLPQFVAAPYAIDFGFVIRDIPVCYTVLIFNYGPAATELKLLEDNRTALLEKEIKIEFKSRELAVGDSMPLYVIFAPTKRRYLELNKKIEDEFRFSVKQGVIITVQVKAEVTLPVVSLQHEELHFDKVYCGDVLRKSVVLFNRGNVTSKWFASINKPSRKEQSKGFFVIPSQGELEPGRQTLLDIYFTPFDENKIRRTLRIDVASNSDPVILKLRGEGLEASLMIVPYELKFGPTLSYFEQTLNFAVQNMAEIPVEFYFPTLDEDSENERRLIDVYLKYKNLKSVFVPLRNAGHALPDFFAKVYGDLVGKLRAKMIAAKESCHDSKSKVSSSEGTETKHGQKSVTKIDEPLAKYSAKELHGLLMDYINAEGFETDVTSNTTTYRMEDSAERIEIVGPPSKSFAEDSERKAAFFIFHGAPNTDYYRGANQVEIALSLPLYSIDRLIIEALVENVHPVAADILTTIEHAFSSISNFKSVALIASLDDEDSEYDKILDKIESILAVKPKKGGKSPGKDKDSKASSDKGQVKNKSNGGCFLDISLDSFVDLLRSKLESFPHLIVESLNSTFIRSPVQALYALLRAAGTVEYINLTIMSSTINDYVKLEESKLQRETIIEATPVVLNVAKSTSVPGTKSSRGKSNASKANSDKMSKASRKKSPDITKKVLQGLNKTTKAQLEEFENGYREIWHVAQFWDKKTVSLRKPYTGGIKKDLTPKDSARTMKTSMKRLTSTINLDETSECGLTTWLLLNCSKDRGIDYPQMIRNCISQDQELQCVLRDIEDSCIPKYEECDAVFTAISRPEMRKNEPPLEFIIKNAQGSENNMYPVRPQSKSGSSLKVRRRRSSKGSRKSSDSRTIPEPTLTFAKVENDMDFSSKIVLQSGDLIKYQVTFCPRKCGGYKNSYTIETTKNRVPYRITCTALCEYPRVDMTPEIMFPRTLENYREKASYDHFVFIKDQRIFDFGSVIANAVLEKSLLYASTILLRNISSSICDVTVSLDNELFTIEPSSFVIPPGGEDIVKVSTRAIKTGTFTTQLYLSVKNNPKVEQFTLACSPCKLDFSVHPKSVAFDKVPLNYTAKRIVRLTNTSPVNLRWEFVDASWVTDILDLSQLNGFVGLYSICDVVFRFRPTSELNLPKRYLQIKVFDVNSITAEPCFTENLSVHADSVEYELEVDSHIDFADIKGGVDQRRFFPIYNKGKCEVIVKIEMINNPLESHNFVREFLKITPLVLAIGAQKTENLSILFHPKSSFTVQNLLVFVISMVESIQTGHVVKSYRITMGATCFMPKYQLCPQSRLSFGYVPLETTKKLTIDMTNKGKFPFGFAVLNYAKFLEAQKKGEVLKKGGKSNKSETSGGKSDRSSNKTPDSAKQDQGVKKEKGAKKSKKTKSDATNTSKGKDSKITSAKGEKKKPMKTTKLDIGGFTISPSTGIVSPNEKLVIDVEITPSETKEYKEQIMLKITEIEDPKKNRSITLTAVGCEPRLNFKDLESIFMEQTIVPNVEDFIVPKNVDGCCIFSTNQGVLHFKRVCINTSLEARLNLKNIGYVSSNLTAKIEDFGRNAFSVTPANQIVEPYSSRTVVITFRPNVLEPITGILDLSYNSSTENKLAIPLSGETCLPQIRLLEPASDNLDASLAFGPLCVGFTTTQKLSFKNISPIKCKVLVEMAACDDVLSIVPVGDETLEQLNIKDEDCIPDMRHDLMVNLLPEKVAMFEVVFKPLRHESTTTVLSLHTLYNPFETIKINVSTDSYDDDIIFEGLTPLKLTITPPSDPCLIAKNAIGYLLDLGYLQLNKLNVKSFLIRNRSESDTYKFRFYCSSVVLSPEVGHLKPGGYKEVLVVFKSIVPMVVQREEITCNLTKIQYVNPSENLLSWDDRQKFIYWMADSEHVSPSLESSFASMQTDKSATGNSNVLAKSSVSVGENKKSFFSTGTMKPDDRDTRSTIKSKVIMEGVEPEIVTLPDSFDIVSVYLKVAADYAKYECSVSNLDFPDTYLKKQSVQTLAIKNVGNVQLNLSWDLVGDPKSVSIKKSASESSISLQKLLDDTSLKSASTTSLISSTGSNHIQLDYSPIFITPSKAAIIPGDTGEFLLHFQPTQVGEFKSTLISNIEALDPQLENISIAVRAVASPIPFYFELEDGSTSNGDVTISFENIGVATESVKKLFLVNPTEENVTFEITPMEKKEFSYFVCNLIKGQIRKGKKCLTTFSFRPPILGSFSEHYHLNVSEKDVRKTISLQGLCREPVVYFSENNITLKPTVPNVKTTKSIKIRSDESFPLSFKFIKKTFFSEDQKEQLQLFPVVGQLKPLSDLDIKLAFTSSMVVATNFNVKCFVSKLKSPLNLHVDVSSIKVDPSVTYINQLGEVTYLKEDRDNVIDAAPTFKGRRDIIQFEVANHGQSGISYRWEFDDRHVSHMFKITVDREKEFLKSGCSSVVNLVLEPLRTGTLKLFKITLTIMYGPIYTMYLNAISEKPHYSFSFNEYNFGCCLVQIAETSYYSTVLSFKNLDCKKMLLQNTFEKTANLAVDFSSSLVFPGDVRNIPIKFHPRKVGTYKEDVLFYVSGGKHVIPISGEGVEVKLELCNLKDKFINFGQIMANTVKKYRVAVYNKSAARIDVHFDLFDNLMVHGRDSKRLEKHLMKMPVLPPPPKESKKDKLAKKAEQKTEEKSKETKPKAEKKSEKGKSKKDIEKEEEDRQAAAELLKKQAADRQEYLKSFTILPNMYINIPPRGNGYFDIVVQPTKRMNFEEKIYYEVQDFFEPFCVIKGSSIVPEFSLDKSEVVFSGVIVGCKSYQLVTLRNTGDVTGSFSWLFESKQNIFTLEPKQGFVLPNGEIKIKITFSPKQLKCEFRCKVKCIVKEFKSPLKLLLKGNSAEMPEPTGTVTLTCCVRDKITDNSVIIANNTSEPWLLALEITNQTFSAPKEMTVTASGAVPIPVTYFPKKMTTSKLDEGRLFIKLPDGSGIIYNLIGKAEPPVIKKRIERDIRCKQNVYETLHIQNWLTIRQTFRVQTELLSPLTSKTLYKIFGFKVIELNGLEKCDYKWGIYVVHEGLIDYRVTFKNTETGEYEFFEISYKVGSSLSIETFYFKARVREQITKFLNLENPIDIPVTFTLEGAEKYVTFPKTITVDPYTTVRVPLVYCSLHGDCVNTFLTAKCEELGSYRYALKMSASPPPEEDCVKVVCPLGSKTTKCILFKNSSDKTADFTFLFENDEFYLDRYAPTPPGETSKISFWFEPSRIGTIRSFVSMSSPQIGEYIYGLEGVGTSPTPKGPVAIRQSYPTAIDFKNPFTQDTRFKYTLQPNLFKCEFNEEEEVKAKKVVRFAVQVRSGVEFETSCPTTGSLVIFPADQPEIQWKYYLEYNPLTSV